MGKNGEEEIVIPPRLEQCAAFLIGGGAEIQRLNLPRLFGAIDKPRSSDETRPPS